MSTPRLLAVSTLAGLLVLFLLVLGAAGCSRAARSEGPWMMLTQTNLRPDEAHARMYSVNYQQDGFIPVCTPVRIDVVTERQAELTNLSTGREYTYVFHERSMSGVPIQQHMDLYFGAKCPRETIDALPAIDQQGIREGKVLPGMTRQGVIFAVGYPPPHETPSLEGDQWKYWTSRFGTMLVRFQNGQVVEVVE